MNGGLSVMRKKGTWKAYAFTLLCMLTVMTMGVASMTMSRYVAGGIVTAQGRVALWSHSITGPTADRVARTYRNLGSPGNRNLTSEVQFTITNKYFINCIF